MKVNPMKQKDPQPPSDYWLSLSDLLSVLVFIFITTLVAFSLVYQKEKISYEAIQADLMKAPLSQEMILKQIQQDLSANGIKSDIISQDGILRLQDDAIAFPMAKAYPDLEYRKNLAKIAKVLARQINCYTMNKSTTALTPAVDESFEHCAESISAPQTVCSNPYKNSIQSIMIEGHTDSVPLKAGVGYFDNLTLSSARASTVFRIMRRCAPELESFMNDEHQAVFGVAGYSSSRPAYPEDPRDARNRRIDIRIIMNKYDVKELDQSVLAKYLPEHANQKSF